MRDLGLSIAAFSNVVGRIYDCALDPTLWPEALFEVCRASNFAAGTIDVTELPTRLTRIRQYWNYHPYWVERWREYEEEIAGYWADVPDLATRPLDQPLCVSRETPWFATTGFRFFREWARPQGIIDAALLMVLRERDRIGAISLSRHEKRWRGH